jgi:hypothetical protein
MSEYSELERIPMQYLVINAAQDPSFAHEAEYGGANVGCWIKNQTKKNAYLIAKGWIEEHGWVVLSLEEQYPVSGEKYRGKAEDRQYYEQALVDEEVLSFLPVRKMKKNNNTPAGVYARTQLPRMFQMLQGFQGPHGVRSHRLSAAV